MGNFCDVAKGPPPEKPQSSILNIPSETENPHPLVDMSPLKMIAIPIQIKEILKKGFNHRFRPSSSFWQKGFRKVLLVKKDHKKTNNPKLFAMKILRKSDILNKKLT